VQVVVVVLDLGIGPADELAPGEPLAVVIVLAVVYQGEESRATPS
jgi:hypothetical protein